MALLKNKKIEKYKKRDLSPIAIINVLETTKPDWDSLDEDFKEAYKKCMFLINRFISSKPIYLPLVHILTTSKFSPRRHYDFLRYTIAKQTHYFNLKAYKKEDEITSKTELIKLLAIKKEYDLTEREAKDHLLMISTEEAQELANKWKPWLEMKKLIS
jgi:hypothetical protein